MTPEVSKQIANLLGQVTVSELPQDTGSLFTGEYWLYKYQPTPTSSVDNTAYRIQANDFYMYLCKNVFAFLVWQQGQNIELHPGDFLDKNDTPVIMARKLLDRVPNWIGAVKPANGGKNLSELWFKHFQYYYFDNLNNRLPTMLLKYGDGTMVNKQFDIFIWIDASESMVPEIEHLAESVFDLCTVIFSQNPNNRVSIVQLCWHGYSADANYNKAPQMCRHLEFTSDISEIQRFMNALVRHNKAASLFADRLSPEALAQHNNGWKYSWHGENLWFLRNFADPNYTYFNGAKNPNYNLDTDERPIGYDVPDGHGGWNHVALPGEEGHPYCEDWNPDWSTDNWTVDWSEDPNVKRLFVIISDESCDTYVSITGRLKVPYKKAWFNDSHGHYRTDFPKEPKPGWTTTCYLTPNWVRTNLGTSEDPTGMSALDVVDMVSDKEEQKRIFKNANWGPYIVPPFYVENPVNPKPDGPPGGVLIGETNHWQWDLGGYDGNLNNDREKPWGTDSLLDLGYNRSTHTPDTWKAPFITNGIKVFYLETNDSKVLWDIKDKQTGASRSFNNQIVSCGFKWIQAYNYLIQVELLDPLENDSRLYSIQPSEVASTLEDIFRNEAVVGDDSLWSNSMWASHLESNTIQTLPSVVTKTGKLKKIHVPMTAVIPNENGGSPEDPDDFIWTRYDKRNYIRIVGMDIDDSSTSGWDKTNDHDWVWTDEKFGTPLEPSRTGDVIPEIDQKMGDIDQTLQVIGEFLDDAIASIEPMVHKGKVIFTASKEIKPLQGSWTNVLGNNSDCFVWCGNSSIVGENSTKVGSLPIHSHNTVLQQAGGTQSPIPIQNVSVIGRPEGETVGGIAKTSSAERLMDNPFGKMEDVVQNMANSNAALAESPGGAYRGTVVYSPYQVNAAQQAHNNMPMYYKLRAFVHG